MGAIVVTVSISTAKFFIAQEFNLKSNEALLANGTSYPGCGSINHVTFCFYGFWTEDGDRLLTRINTIYLTNRVVIYSVLVLVLMLLDHSSILSEDLLVSMWPPLKSHSDKLDAQLREACLARKDCQHV